MLEKLKYGFLFWKHLPKRLMCRFSSYWVSNGNTGGWVLKEQHKKGRDVILFRLSRYEHKDEDREVCIYHMREGSAFVRESKFQKYNNGTDGECIRGRTMFGGNIVYSPLKEIVSHEL